MEASFGLGRHSAVEWPTLGLIGLIWALWLSLTWFHAELPLWLWLPIAGWTAAWWGSAQHEALHGHPTGSRAINTALATPPLWLWLPFERYRQTHIVHHRDERLTDPLDDPESRYWTPSDWDALGPLGRMLLNAQGTLAGRLTIGPFWAMGHLWWSDARAILRGDGEIARIWLWHGLWTGVVMAWVLGVCGMPLWQYLLGFAYLGTALTLIRSFAEHRAHAAIAKRTAIVENSAVFGLLFLHNNLHVVHHRWPALAWYRIPAVYREHRAALIAANGGLVYDGYGDLFRRFLLRRHDQPVHPAGRAIATQAGTG